MEPSNTIFFCCDIQDRFRSAIFKFPHLVNTSTKLVKFATLFEIPIIVTEQAPKSLGATVGELQLPSTIIRHPKTKFSMLIPPVLEALEGQYKHVRNVVIFGLEAHVCVLQTALDLVSKFGTQTGRGINVYIALDGVSSCNKEEIPIAANRMQASGIHISTSESLMFQLMNDASDEKFKKFSALIKEKKVETKDALSALLGSVAMGDNNKTGDTLSSSGVTGPLITQRVGDVGEEATTGVTKL